MISNLRRAQDGDINAFHTLFSDFQSSLKSYLYRLLVDRNEVEDISQDTFVKAFNKIKTFDNRSSLKSWVFRIATNLAYDRLRNKKTWSEDVLEKAKNYAHNNDAVVVKMKNTSEYSTYDIYEHIDFCFTCISKVLPLKQQVAVILKDIYQFKVKEIALILDKTVPAAKHLLSAGRQTMTKIFDNRCSLVNKKGACNQCSELNDYLNPKQKEQEIKIREYFEGDAGDNQKLYDLRSALIRFIDPLNIKGIEIHDIFMQLNKIVEGESNEINLSDDN